MLVRDVNPVSHSAAMCSCQRRHCSRPSISILLPCGGPPALQSCRSGTGTRRLLQSSSPEPELCCLHVKYTAHNEQGEMGSTLKIPSALDEAGQASKSKLPNLPVEEAPATGGGRGAESRGSRRPRQGGTDLQVSRREFLTVGGGCHGCSQ